MKAEDYFITLMDDIDIINGLEGVFCNCFCCNKFGYHSVTVKHKPTGLESTIVTKIMELPSPYWESFQKAIDSIESPQDVAIKGLKVKIKQFCEGNKMMNQKNELAGRILGSIGMAQSSVCKVPDVMRLNSRHLNCEQTAIIEQIKEIGNNFHAYLEILSGMESPIDKNAIEIAKRNLEACVMWAVKGVSA